MEEADGIVVLCVPRERHEMDTRVIRFLSFVSEILFCPLIYESHILVPHTHRQEAANAPVTKKLQ